MRVHSNGKVRRTASEWREIFGRFEKSNLSPREFCHRESLSVESFRRWREKLAAKPVKAGADSFVEVASEEAFPAFWSLEIELPDGRMVRVRG
jgi:hypothetical protein